jgi:hypothetical protein
MLAPCGSGTGNGSFAEGLSGLACASPNTCSSSVRTRGSRALLRIAWKPAKGAPYTRTHRHAHTQGERAGCLGAHQFEGSICGVAQLVGAFCCVALDFFDWCAAPGGHWPQLAQLPGARASAGSRAQHGTHAGVCCYSKRCAREPLAEACAGFLYQPSGQEPLIICCEPRRSGPVRARSCSRALTDAPWRGFV